MFKKHKNKIIISSLVIIGVILILYGSVFKKTETVTDNFNAQLYTEALEKKIENFLNSVDGIKNVKVIVSLDTSVEHVYAQNQSTFDYLIINSGDKENAVSITDIYPSVRGIAVACTNGNNPSVQMEITELLSRYLGISTNRIKIVSFG